VNDVVTIKHISEKPWSAYTEADYTLQQWHNACLIHMHDGPPTSKSECKLPVKTPNGAVNRNGVHAATAALHGARSPLQASADEKAKAASALKRLYVQLGEKPPPSLSQSEITQEHILNFIEHHGVKGMRWGVRKGRSGGGGSSDVGTERTRFGKSPKRLSSTELEARIRRMENEKKYNSLNKRDVGPGQAMAAKVLHDSGNKIAKTLVTNTSLHLIGKLIEKQTKNAELGKKLTKTGK
jgi:hypothetical protein